MNTQNRIPPQLVQCGEDFYTVDPTQTKDSIVKVSKAAAIDRLGFCREDGKFFDIAVQEGRVVPTEREPDASLLRYFIKITKPSDRASARRIINNAFPDLSAGVVEQAVSEAFPEPTKRRQ